MQTVLMWTVRVSAKTAGPETIASRLVQMGFTVPIVLLIVRVSTEDAALGKYNTLTVVQLCIM